MGSQDELDGLLALGSQRPPQVEACTDEAAIDDGDLLAYRRGALSEAEKERVEQHLVDCPFCRDLLAHLEVPRRGRRWMAVLVGTAASIAAAILFVGAPPPRDPIGPYAIVDVQGSNAEERGPEEVYRPEAPLVFNRNSQVRIKVEAKQGRAASIVRVFRLENGVLVDVPAHIEPGVSGVFLIEGDGHTMFGESAGQKRLVIVAADEGADLSRIAGRTIIAAQALTTQTSWLPLIDVDYRSE